jgi:hypothetical protein
VCSFQNPDNRISILQMNSDLEHAQLELLGAHCAVHQLRLRYSSDELARFGRRDVLHKSAEAAASLHDFYAAIEDKVFHAAPAPPAPEPSAEQIAQAIEWLAGYLREQREQYSPVATQLTNEVKARMWPFFSADLLDRIRIIELRGARVHVPEFFAKVRALGFEPPQITHMDSVTFLDIVAFNQSLSERALFHALVHTVQIDVLGLQRYAELWVYGFLKTRTHFTVPLEVHAFSLSSKFLRPMPERFSVEDEVVRWVDDGRY